MEFVSIMAIAGLFPISQSDAKLFTYRVSNTLSSSRTIRFIFSIRAVLPTIAFSFSGNAESCVRFIRLCSWTGELGFIANYAANAFIFSISAVRGSITDPAFLWVMFSVYFPHVKVGKELTNMHWPSAQRCSSAAQVLFAELLQSASSSSVLQSFWLSQSQRFGIQSPLLHLNPQETFKMGIWISR